jgi:hypothetical protein
MTIFPSALGQMNDNFVKCPDEALEWNSRKFRIIEEIVEYCPDIICLQVSPSLAKNSFYFLWRLFSSRKWTTSTSSSTSWAPRATPESSTRSPTPLACTSAGITAPTVAPSSTGPTSSTWSTSNPEFWRSGGCRATRCARALVPCVRVVNQSVSGGLVGEPARQGDESRGVRHNHAPQGPPGRLPLDFAQRTRKGSVAIRRPTLRRPTGGALRRLQCGARRARVRHGPRRRAPEPW